jgi:hypothetical protein
MQGQGNPGSPGIEKCQVGVLLGIVKTNKVDRS